MTHANRFALMLEALTELAVEETSSRQTPPTIAQPSLREILSLSAPLPREALFLGLAEDGLPVLLNLRDPIPGPLLVTGDSTSGKTMLLQTVARAVELLHTPSDVQFAVISSHPDEWTEYQEYQNCAGIYPSGNSSSQDLLFSLVSWAHNNKGEKQSVLLLIDDFESATRFSREAVQNLRWLLLRGPSRQVWPIVTLNAGRAKNVDEWLGFFRTRLFGHIQNADDTKFATGLSDIALDDLIAGSQFTMREGNNWLNFWIPASD